MRMVRDVLSLGLVTSALLGILILATDQWLWAAAPSHAYGLIAFVILDILVAMAVLEKLGVGTLAAGIASFVQVTVMIGDLFTGQPEGVSPIAFRAYLASDPSYIGLLFVKTIIVAFAIASMTIPFLQSHAHRTKSLQSPRTLS